jgi:ribosomal protein S18 acetylase RimI-like enzyme
MASLPGEFTIRSATPRDVSTIVGHRRAMFRDMRSPDEATLNSMAARFGPWLKQKMQAQEYLAWLAVTGEGEVAAGAGLWLMDWPPHVLGAGPRRGNILNVYTERAFRRRGLARALMEVALAWCRENQVDLVILHASPEGRALYESMGFEASNEMRVTL